MKRMGLKILAIGLFLLVQAAQAQWTQAKRLTWTSDNSIAPAITISSNNIIHIVWWDFSAGTGSGIYYKKSKDGGATWSAIKNLTPLDYAEHPALAVDLTNCIYLVWNNLLGNQVRRVYYRKSIDGGRTWTEAKCLTTGLDMQARAPAISVDSNKNIHILYQRPLTPPEYITYHKKSTDGGLTWSLENGLFKSGGQAPAIAIDASNTIHVLWENSAIGNYEIYSVVSNREK